MYNETLSEWSGGAIQKMHSRIELDSGSRQSKEEKGKRKTRRVINKGRIKKVRSKDDLSSSMVIPGVLTVRITTDVITKKRVNQNILAKWSMEVHLRQSSLDPISTRRLKVLVFKTTPQVASLPWSWLYN